MARERLLIVDDEEDILELLRFNLALEGYELSLARSGESALQKAAFEKPDLILLDLMLPGIDGLEVARRLKDNPQTRFIPIIILSAKGEDSDIVAGLELRADDYITKPFSPRVLIARVRAALRRSRPRGEETPERVIRRGDLEIRPDMRRVTVQGEPVDLTHTEFKLLTLMASRPGWTLSRSQIVDRIRGPHHAVTDRAVDVQIVGLRKKLGPRADLIETVRGAGYRFKAT
ncbi:DNA-binding response regulator in two-component regulatory system with PhoR (or CreC) [Candidatus Desulfarcum epimagneticum]|uniref:DNA-binding response regulator in two-component regulatory system with PhoR (Or CreC) n=1 Tax=uncultured Desulfobacteraceae bacterium TaxID=218296 RepID=A0A484HLU8_9BACT|nr:DNA-binding response regulator in two-component regulatory system with PhoR (or CreC) [uncultured Desulfobacteraceae bacterium]